MALQVWLPLNGNLNNQGLSNVTVTNSGATVNSAGKIGSCYDVAISNKYLTVNNLPFTSLTNCSITFWIKISSKGSNWWLPFSGQTNLYYVMATTNGTGAFYHSNVGSNTKTIYCDGIIRTTPIDDGKWHHYCITGLDLSTWTTFYINNYFQYATYWNFAGSLNDIRIYDHCLSPKEVKEIAKGLVLHYKLDDPWVEGTTNLSNPLYTTVTNAGWGAHRGTSTLVTAPSGVPFSQCNKLDVTYNTSLGSGGGVGILCSSITVEPSTTYCYSTYILPDDNLAYSVANFLYRYEYASGTYVTETGIYTSSKKQYIGNGWYRIYNTFTTSSTTNNVQLYFFTYPNKNITYYLGGVQLEKKDHLTPFVNGTRAQGQIYDCSGYGRNGTIGGAISMSANTSRYSNSTVFDGSTNNVLSSFPSYDTDVTFAIWAKPSKFGVHLLDCRNSSGVGYQPMFINSDSVQIGGSATAFTNIYCSLSINNWNHIVVVESATKGILYVNGVKVGESTSAKGYNYSQNLPVHIASRYSNQYWYGGNISDFRIYSTALSESDIKDLYQTSAAIHNTGNIEAFEFVETNTASRELNPFAYASGSSAVYLANGDFQMTGHIWPNSDYIPINPTGKTYYYDVEYSNTSGGHLYVGFERYDANKQSGSNSECQYVVSTTGAYTHARATGTVNLATANGNTAAYTKLRLLNDWDNSSGSKVGTIHYISLKEVTTKTTSDIKKNGVFEGDAFIESKDASISHTGNVVCNQIIEI